MKFFSALFAIILFMNEYGGAVIGTCTQGDDTTLFVSTYLSLALFVISILFYLPGIKKRRVELGYFFLCLSFLLAFTWRTIFVETLILGNHFCGESFNTDFASVISRQRIFVGIHLWFVLGYLGLGIYETKNFMATFMKKIKKPRW